MDRVKNWTSILLAACAALQVGVAGQIFKGGRWKEFVYDKPTMEPVVFGGESRSENATAAEYCIYLDLWYDDGTPVWGVCANWRQGTHGWEKTASAFVPQKPVKKIQYFAFLRKGSGKAEFRDLWLARRRGNCDILSVTRRTARPFSDGDRLEFEIFEGTKIVRRTADVPAGCGPWASGAVPCGGFGVWTADSMRRVTPLTFPTAAELAAPKMVELELAKRERESFQVQVTCGDGVEWTRGGVKLPVLKNEQGVALKGEFKWERVGYLARESDYRSHSCGVDEEETWLPDPLLPAAPFRVRKASTQGLWFTVYAAPDAAPGVYTGDVVVTEGESAKATVRVAVRVLDFSLPAKFGFKTSFSVMDGFTRAQYGEAKWKEMKRRSWDVMLDHRLNPDDISRTTPPEIADLLHARDRGMNSFNILNIVPPPKDPHALWVCYAAPEAVFNDTFYGEFKARLAPYVAELRKHDLLKDAYLYGFDERQKEYYEGIDRLWKQLKADFLELPVMTTAMMYRDLADGKVKSPYLETTDWFCPLTPVYRPELSAKLRAKGKQVWWYTCCGPCEPYANMASIEYPAVEGRILGWMAHLYDSDGLLFWHVNYWHGKPIMDEGDTFFPDWPTRNGLKMPGDGIFLYPGREHVLPGIRLALVRDGVEDYEWLQLAAAKVGKAAVDAETRTLVKSMTEFTRDPARLRAVRRRVAELIVHAARKENL